MIRPIHTAHAEPSLPQEDPARAPRPCARPEILPAQPTAVPQQPVMLHPALGLVWTSPVPPRPAQPLPRLATPKPYQPELQEQLQERLRLAHLAFLELDNNTGIALRDLKNSGASALHLDAANKNLCGKIDQLTNTLIEVFNTDQAARINPTILKSCLAKYLQTHRRHVAYLLEARLTMMTAPPCLLQPRGSQVAQLGLQFGDFTLYLPADRAVLEDLASRCALNDDVLKLISDFYKDIAQRAQNAVQHGLASQAGSSTVSALNTMSDVWRRYSAQIAPPVQGAVLTRATSLN